MGKTGGAAPSDEPMDPMPQHPAPSARLRPRPDQRAAIAAGARQLRTRGSRALITSACGTGKTLTAIRIAGALDARRVLNVFPTLDLLAQTALAWRQDGRDEAMVAFSSMDAEAHEGLRAAGVGGTNDPRGLARALAALPRLTVFTTYASLDGIEATQHTGIEVPAFDLAVMDEAHRVSGRADKTWAIVHDARRVRADRRLYLTATPRVWDSPDLTESPSATPRPRPLTRGTPPADQHALSMDDPAVFGPRVHDYDLPTAIADNVLADYRVLVPTITDAQLRTQLNLTTAGPDARRTTALHLAVAKALTDHHLRHVLVYFNEVEAATAFAREFPHTLRALPPGRRPTPPPWVGFIHGDHTPTRRRRILADFTAADRAVLTNAKLLAEGIDITGIDGIVFADATRSVVRCVQALGRALRKPAGTGKVSSLIVPAYVPPGADPTDLLGTAYEPVWSIAAALRSHDHRIMERLPNRVHRLPGETSRIIASRWRFDFDTDPESIARAMDLMAFDPRGPLSLSRRRGLASLQAFRAEFGHLAVPHDHVDAYGFATGVFVEGQRSAHAAGRLDDDPEWVGELDALGMIWNVNESAWRAHMATVRAYHDEHGHLAIPRHRPGGAFLADQRSRAGRGELHPDRLHELDAVAPDWQLPFGPDWTRKYHTLRAHVRAGHDPAGISHDTVIGDIKAGSWLHRQFSAWTDLAPGQRELLTALHLTPGAAGTPGEARTARRSFARTAEILKLFVQREGHLPASRDWATVDGKRVMIGPWLAKTRTRKRAGELSPEHDSLLTRLLGPGWDTPAPAPADERRERDGAR